VILHLARKQSVLRHGRNQARQLDLDSFVFEKSFVHGDKQRQIAH
jgi:hypothetical protein